MHKTLRVTLCITHKFTFVTVQSDVNVRLLMHNQT